MVAPRIWKAEAGVWHQFSIQTLPTHFLSRREMRANEYAPAPWRPKPQPPICCPWACSLGGLGIQPCPGGNTGARDAGAWAEEGRKSLRPVPSETLNGLRGSTDQMQGSVGERREAQRKADPRLLYTPTQSTFCLQKRESHLLSIYYVPGTLYLFFYGLWNLTAGRVGTPISQQWKLKFRTPRPSPPQPEVSLT